MGIISPKWLQLKDVKIEIYFNMIDVKSCQSEQGGPKSHTDLKVSMLFLQNTLTWTFTGFVVTCSVKAWFNSLEVKG